MVIHECVFVLCALLWLCGVSASKQKSLELELEYLCDYSSCRDRDIEIKIDSNYCRREIDGHKTTLAAIRSSSLSTEFSSGESESRNSTLDTTTHVYIYTCVERQPSPGVYFWDVPPVFHLYPACVCWCRRIFTYIHIHVSHRILAWYPVYPCIDIDYISIHFAADPLLYPAVSHCIQLHPYVTSYI